jgi:membrane fusion protein (multidrug efflux system)
VALAGGGAYLVAHWGLVETDNAQLQGHLTEISSRVNGTIARVLVEDNQEVKVGQPLLQLDDRDARARLFRARADLEQVAREAQAMAAQAGASVSTARAAEGMAVADQQSASSELARAAGSRFALLPPDNATGNFTKVVQRITARIDLDPRDTKGLKLVPGLSATVSVRRP